MITRAENIYLWDSDGKKILDAMSGLWCVNVGYGRQELIDAATRQLEGAALLQQLLPDRDAAGHRARRAARRGDAAAVPARVLLRLRLGGQRHGGAHGAPLLGHPRPAAAQGHHQPQERLPRLDHGRRLAGRHERHARTRGLPIPDIVHIEQPFWFELGRAQSREDFGLTAARWLEAKILEIGADKVAAFIGEPIQGAGGVIVPPSTYWPEIQRICDKHGILLVSDEVITGFGRTGQWFGCETMGTKPDLDDLRQGA